jgi:glutaredoxin
MIELSERPKDSPICPHCESAVKTLYYQLLSKWFGRRYIYFCGQCKKVLGLSHRKGFFMG